VEEKDKIREEEEKDVEAHKRKKLHSEEPKAEDEKGEDEDVELHGRKRL
jgi:hypothetical protein